MIDCTTKAKDSHICDIFCSAFSEVSELDVFYWMSVLCILLQARGATVAHVEPEGSLFVVLCYAEKCVLS